MTIDERLGKLTERHEALTLTLELIAAMQRELTRGIQGLRTNFLNISFSFYPHLIFQLDLNPAMPYTSL